MQPSWFAGFGLILALMTPNLLSAATVIRLAWDPNTEPDLAGYHLKYGTTSGIYQQTIDVGNVTSYDVRDLAANQTYYFVVLAYDLAGNESPPSNEVSAQPTVIVGVLLNLTGSDSPDPVSSGGNITYTLSYSNTGDTAATGVVVSDTVPANTTFVSATGGGTLASGVVSWTIGTLNAAASGSVQMVVRVASPLANGTLITNGTYSIRCNETPAVAGAAISTTVSSAPVLAISKTDAPDPVTAGSNVTYTLSYSNTGNANATGVVVSDTVPANTTFVSATGGGTLASGVVSWSIGTLNAGASSSVQMVVRVASPLANGTVITNGTYSIRCNETPAVAGAAISTTVSSSPTLTITKTDAPDPVTAGSNVTYTLSYSNTGNANATGVVVSDTVPANTTFVSATGGGTLASGVVSWSIGTLNAGASGSVQMVVRVASPLANGTLITNGTYSIRCNETPAVAGAAISTTVGSAPVLALTLADAPDPVAAGGNITYTISFANTGNANATGVVVSDTVPANTTFVSATGGGTPASGVVSWSIGTLNAGTSGSVQLVVRVASPLANGTLITNDRGQISSNETGQMTGAPITTSISSSPAPTISSVVETATNSIYILQGGIHVIQVLGTNFQSGAVLNLSADVSIGVTTLIGTTQLSASITLAPTAALGPRTLTVTNPDSGSAQRAGALTVVKTPDINRDCVIDGTDLNALARAWNTTSSDPAFNPAADFDGDNYVGPIDLTIFATYFGQRLSGCP